MDSFTLSITVSPAAIAAALAFDALVVAGALVAARLLHRARG